MQNIESKLIKFQTYFTLPVFCVHVLQYFTGSSCLRYYLNKKWRQLISISTLSYKGTAEYTENSKHLPKYEWHFKIYASIWVKRGPFLGGPPRHATAANLGSRLSSQQDRAPRGQEKILHMGCNFVKGLDFSLRKRQSSRKWLVPNADHTHLAVHLLVFSVKGQEPHLQTLTETPTVKPLNAATHS